MCLLIFVMVLFSFYHPEAAIKAIIFDCDGILVDTEELKFQAWKTVLQTRDIFLSFEDYQPLIGGTGLSILNQIAKEHNITLDPRIVDEKNELYWVLQKNELKSIAPMIEVIEWVKTKHEEKEILLGVATSASRNEVFFNLDYLKIRDLFDVILSGKDDLTKYKNPFGVNKPQPYIYLEMSHRLGIQPGECLVLEDSEPGVCAAKSAGCKVIAVPTNWTMDQNFENADLVLRSANAHQLIENIQYFLQEQ